MTATTHAEFNANTEALEVAKAFPESIRGKTVLVTGVNLGGIGFTTAQAFVSNYQGRDQTEADEQQASQAPAHLIIAGRNSSRVQDCIDALEKQYPDVGYRSLKLDLSNQKAVRAAAQEALSWTDIPSIDIIVNNAAIMNIPERQLSEEGIEITFATNHIAHYLFTCLMMPKLIKAAETNPRGTTRVINVTSLSPTVATMRWSDINQEKVNKTLPQSEQPSYDMHRRFGAVDPEEKSYLPLEGYNQSKVANVLFSIALNNRLYEKYGILSFACHPGVIFTELGRYANQQTREAVDKMLGSGMVPMKSLAAGSSTTLVAATDPKLGMPETKDGKENLGVYFIDCQISVKATPGASSSSEAEKLWKLSQEMVKEEFAW